MRELRVNDNEYKLLYYRTSSNRNGVAIAVAERFPNKISRVQQISDRLIAVKIHKVMKAMQVVICLSRWMQYQ